MRIRYLIVPAAFLGLVLTTGCDREGPAERAGEQIDEAMEKGQSSVEEAVEETGEKLESAGDAIREKTQ